MTAVKTVPFPTRSPAPINRNRLRPPPRQISRADAPRTGAWPSDIEQRLGTPREQPAKPRIVLRPMLGPHDGLDVTEAVTRAVAQELWNLHGGNDVMNWIEAERLLAEFIERRSPFIGHGRLK